MPRPKRAIPTVQKGIRLSSDIVAAVELQLYSEVQGRVPLTAWQSLLEDLLRKWLKDRAKQAQTADPQAST